MIKRLVSLFIIVAQVVSCSTIIEIDTKREIKLKKNVDDFKTKVCPIKDKANVEVISNNKEATKAFLDIRKRFLPRMRNEVELAVLFLLIQMNFRPDITSPTADTQLLYGKGNSPKFILFKKKPDKKPLKKKKKKKLEALAEKEADKKDDKETKTEKKVAKKKVKKKKKKYVDHGAYPLLKSIEHLIKEAKTGRTLRFYLNFLDNQLNRKIWVDKEMAKAFIVNKSLLDRNNKLVEKSLFKADQILQQGESLPKLQFFRLGALKVQDNKIITLRHLFDYNRVGAPKNEKVSCNFDMNLYDNSIFPVANEKRTPNVFGFKSKNFFFVAMTHQKTNWKQLVGRRGLLLFDRFDGFIPSGMCLIKNKGSLMALFSSHSRDPGQHLYQSIITGIDQSTSVDELKTYLTFPRHLFLLNPPRLLLETERSTKVQLQQFLMMQVPIFHQTSLGKLWVYSYKKKKNRSYFILDPRHESSLSCR